MGQHGIRLGRVPEGVGMNLDDRSIQDTRKVTIQDACGTTFHVNLHITLPTTSDHDMNHLIGPVADFRGNNYVVLVTRHDEIDVIGWCDMDRESVSYSNMSMEPDFLAAHEWCQRRIAEMIHE